MEGSPNNLLLLLILQSKTGTASWLNKKIFFVAPHIAMAFQNRNSCNQNMSTETGPRW